MVFGRSFAILCSVHAQQVNNPLIDSAIQLEAKAAGPFPHLMVSGKARPYLGMRSYLHEQQNIILTCYDFHTCQLQLAEDGIDE